MRDGWKYICIGILLLLCTLSVVSAKPLVVTYTEKLNITATVNGEGTANYSVTSITGHLIINNTAPQDTLSDVWVAINIPNNYNYSIKHDYTPKGVYVTDTVPGHIELPQGLTYVHIPVLPPGEYVEIVFQLNGSQVGVPIVVNETYSETKVPANKMVTWYVTFNIYRNDSALPNTPVLVNVTKYLSNDPDNYGSPYWTHLSISNASANQGDTPIIWDGPYTSGSNDALNWTGVTLNSTHHGSLTFTVSADNIYNQGGAVEADYGFAVIFFKFNGTVGASIEGVYAVGDGEVSVCKKGPDLDTTTGKYTLWYENTSFKNRGSDYYYNITKVRIWAVNGSNPPIVDPYDTNLLIPGSEHIITPNELLAPGGVWSSITYNFTFEGVPVIWADYTFKVVESNITLINETINEYSDKYGSSCIVVERIYLVSGYLIKVTKHIFTNPDGTYNIDIVVENVGSEKSPYIYVYDMIPHNFTIISGPYVRKWYMLNHSGSFPLTNNPRYYLSLYWCLKPLSGGADGDGEADSIEVVYRQAVEISYTLKGNGTFLPSDLYIVGIDPIHSLLPTTSPKMVIVGGVLGNNYEVLLALLTGVFGTVLVVKRVRR